MQRTKKMIPPHTHTRTYTFFKIEKCYSRICQHCKYYVSCAKSFQTREKSFSVYWQFFAAFSTIIKRLHDAIFFGQSGAPSMPAVLKTVLQWIHTCVVCLRLHRLWIGWSPSLPNWFVGSACCVDSIASCQKLRDFPLFQLQRICVSQPSCGHAARAGQWNRAHWRD